jgi:predicted metal-dependent hydrolase
MEIKVKYSKRKTLALEITRNAEVLVRAPIGTSKKRIDEFTKSHWEWLISH